MVWFLLEALLRAFIEIKKLMKLICPDIISKQERTYTGIEVPRISFNGILIKYWRSQTMNLYR